MAENTKEMEAKLQKLLAANSEENRPKAAEDLKRRGKVIVGTTDCNTPEEIIYAAGMLPWRLTGTWHEDVALAHAYRSPDTDVYCNHLLQSHLAGELDFLDGIVIGCEDDDMRRLWDAWDFVGKTPFTDLLYAPHKDHPVTRAAYVEALTVLKTKIEGLSGAKLSDDALSNATEVYNEWRTLLMQVYELRKREIPPISGAEALKLVTASFVMPKDEYNKELKTLLPYLEQRKTSVKSTWPRLLVSGDKLDNPAYLELVEGVGCLVAMDDLDTGSRYFWKTTSLDRDPIVALAERYISRPPCPHFVDWPQNASRVIGWAREYNITGVLNLPHMYGYVRQMGTPYFQQKLAEAGIPVMSFNIEYHLANVGQLRTRIGAFVELLTAGAQGEKAGVS